MLNRIHSISTAVLLSSLFAVSALAATAIERDKDKAKDHAQAASHGGHVVKDKDKDHAVTSTGTINASGSRDLARDRAVNGALKIKDKGAHH